MGWEQGTESGKLFRGVTFKWNSREGKILSSQKEKWACGPGDSLGKGTKGQESIVLGERGGSISPT